MFVRRSRRSPKSWAYFESSCLKTKRTDLKKKPSQRGSFKGAPVRVRVPATTANLGSGFDSAGLALGLYDDVVAQVVDEPGFSIDVHGEGQDAVPRDHKHLVARAMQRTFDVLDVNPMGVTLVCANRIPQSRGLGSSAAATCAGVMLAIELVPGAHTSLSPTDMVALAAEIEGHPDNVAACFSGGLTLVWQQSNGQDQATILESRSWPVLPSIRPLVMVPTTLSSTKKARSVLPEQVPLAAAVANLSRSALLVEAFTADPTLLMAATEDSIHQKYRAELMPKSLETLAMLRDMGLPAAISGAGPSLVAFVDAPDSTSFDSAVLRLKDVAGAKFEVLDLAVDSLGARVEPLD